MPKKSKKSKSKRQTLKNKYKVLKKVKEHHRKKRKEAKKNGNVNKGPKDPGIPNNWPFKEELIQQLKASKERAAAHQKALRDAKQDAVINQGGLQAIQEGAAARGQAYEKAAGRAVGVAAAPGGGYVDYSLKAFYKDFAKVVEASDVIIEVVDARDPVGSRCLEVEKFVRRMGANKKIIILMNKIDLVPREVVEEWLKHLREELPTVAFKCSTQRQATNLGRKQLSSAADAALKGSECLGADTLLQLLKNYARGTSGLKQSITVGVVGLPNVGKSSLINSLKRTRVAQVGNAPGVTKGIQEVHLDRQVTLLDSPGVVFSDAGVDGAAAAALRNCVKVEQLEDPVLPVAEIVRRCPAKQLMTLYKVPAYKDVDGFLTHVATARGKLRRGGVVDTSAAARIVLQDWNDGRIPYFTRPTKRQTEIEGTAAVVSDWGADFDAAAVFAAEQHAVVDGLPSLEDAASGFFQTESVGAAHVNLDAPVEEEDEEEEDAMSGSDIDEDEDEEDGDAMDDGEATAPATRVTRSSKDAQNTQLYNQKGQFNPKLAKAQRKKAKKESVETDGPDSGSDFEFDEVDFDDAKHANAFAELASDEEEDGSDME
jgi:nuclear GTP-binding protein